MLSMTHAETNYAMMNPATEGKVVVNFNNDNPIIVERISRIINYIYENHANRITLKELAEREHLSTFYISHLIRDYIGMNFQELLCFARVEMSEILLLETDRKISAIAREVGFSTTSYYNKFFQKWFGHTPLEYRQLYTPHVLGMERPVRLKLLSDNQAVSLIRRCMSAVSDQEKHGAAINRHYLTVDVNPQMSPVIDTQHLLEVIITQEDYQVMGEKLFDLLHELGASRVILAFRQGDGEERVASIEKWKALMMERLHSDGYEVSAICGNDLSCGFSAGHDSIAAAIHLFRKWLVSQENVLRCRLRDQGERSRILKGTPSCLTSCLVPKPSFHAYRLLNHIKGKLLCWGKYYYVIKNSLQKTDSYTFVTINYNDAIQNLCMRNVGIYEANDIISSFQDERNIDFSISVEPGQYVIAKYGLSNSNSIFEHMAHLGFPDAFPLPENWIYMLNTAPESQVGVEKVDGKLNINSAIKGAGIHIIVVEKITASHGIENQK